MGDVYFEDDRFGVTFSLKDDGNFTVHLKLRDPATSERVFEKSRHDVNTPDFSFSVHDRKVIEATSPGQIHTPLDLDDPHQWFEKELEDGSIETRHIIQQDFQRVVYEGRITAETKVPQTTRGTIPRIEASRNFHNPNRTFLHNQESYIEYIAGLEKEDDNVDSAIFRDDNGYVIAVDVLKSDSREIVGEYLSVTIFTPEQDYFSGTFNIWNKLNSDLKKSQSTNIDSFLSNDGPPNIEFRYNTLLNDGYDPNGFDTRDIETSGPGFSNSF